MFTDLDFYSFAVNASLVLTVVVVALAGFALLSRRQVDHRQHHRNRMRPRMQRALAAYLDNRAPLAMTVPALATDRKLALELMLDVASTRGGTVQQQLQPVFEHFDFEKAELQELTHRDYVRRVRAAIHLGYLGSDAAIPAVLGALQDEKLEVRLAAAQSLVQLGHASAAIPIVEAIALPGRWAQQRATDLLYGLGPAVVPVLEQFLANAGEETTPAMCVAAINAIGMHARGAASAPIRDALHSEHAEIRVAAARAVGGIGDVTVTDKLIEALRDDSWEVRSQAATSLGKLRPGSAQGFAAIAALDSAMSDSVWWVRFNAANALAELGTIGMQALQRASTEHADAFARDMSREILEERTIFQAPVALPA